MHTVHPCAEIHNAMSELTGNANETSEQHRELEVARIAIDVKNLHIYRKLSIPRKSRAYVYLYGSDKANEISAKIYASIIKQTSAKVPRKRRLLL